MSNKYAFIFLISITIFISCTKSKDCGDPIYPSFDLLFADSVHGYLYREATPVVHPDSLAIYTATGDTVWLTKILRNWLGWNPPQWIFAWNNFSRNNPHNINTEQCNEYIIKYAYNIADTIKICYNSYIVGTGKCTNMRYKYMNVYLRGHKIFADSNSTIGLINIIR